MVKSEFFGPHLPVGPAIDLRVLYGHPFGKVGTSHTSQLQLEKRSNLATWLLIIMITGTSPVAWFPYFSSCRRARRGGTVSAHVARAPIPRRRGRPLARPELNSCKMLRQSHARSGEQRCLLCSLRTVRPLKCPRLRGLLPTRR